MEEDIEAAVLDGEVRFAPDDGLRLVGNGKPGDAQHGQVVGAVAHDDRLVGGAPEVTARRGDTGGLGPAINDLAQDTAGESSMLHLERVGQGVVEAEAGLEAVGEVGKPARDQERGPTGGAGGGEERLGPGREPEAFVVNLLECLDGQSLKQGHPCAQGGREIQFPAHGRRGDLGHARLEPGHVGDLVDALDGDEGGVHVHRQELELLATQRRVGKEGVEALGMGLIDEAGVSRGTDEPEHARRRFCDGNGSCALLPGFGRCDGSDDDEVLHGKGNGRPSRGRTPVGRLQARIRSNPGFRRS